MRTTAYKCVAFSLLLLLLQTAGAQSAVTVTSPDGMIRVRVQLKGGALVYSVTRGKDTVLLPSALGLVRADGDFSKGLALVSAPRVQPVTDRYTMVNAKKRTIRYQANRQTLRLRNAAGEAMDLVFQVSNDGLAFRYVFPGPAAGVKTVREELTAFHFPPAARAWLQPMSVAKSGWESTNPAYEEHYRQNMAVGTPAPNPAGWVYPALFQSGSNWLLITEAALDSNYCGTRLGPESAGGIYRVAFPDPREVSHGGGLLPQGRLPFATPWRVLAIGSLKTIAESTLGTDVAPPAIRIDTALIRPGKASWSWINSKDDSIVYSEQQRYVDFAADMNWQYCLIDVNWDRKIGYERIAELARYAAAKNVGLLLWYNSSGDWNTTRYTPKSRLLTHEDRVKEFSRLQAMGIKGVKIDFFGGDGRSVIGYYMDMLRDAEPYGLLVNFHGATLPRGWHRTWPHLMTAEGVRGFEMVTFGQRDADLQPTHCTMLPFTRNAFDPMDFTPMNLYRIPTNVRRKTTSAFELALSVLFLSGIQHYAESPAGMQQVPDYVKEFLRTLPSSWEDVQFIDGYPGKYVVLARKSGSRWYLCGINGEAAERRLTLNLAPFGKRKASYLTDGKEALSFTQETFNVQQSPGKEIILQPNGGFVLVLE